MCSSRTSIFQDTLCCRKHKPEELLIEKLLLESSKNLERSPVESCGMNEISKFKFVQNDFKLMA